MSKEIEVDIGKFLMKGIAGTIKSYKYIDEYFYREQEKCARYVRENKSKWLIKT